MIAELDTLPDPELEAEVCIVGAGATGLALALELVASGLRVVLVESGGWAADHTSDRLNHGVNSGSHEVDLVGSRARGFGGTTQRWAGQCVPFEEEDLSSRPWVPEASWPFTRRALDPYYRRAERLFELPPSRYDESVWAGMGIDLPAFDPRRLRHRCTIFPRRVRLGRLAERPLRESRAVTVVLSAHVTQVELEEDGRAVTGVRLRSGTGRGGRVRAQRVVLCAGGIENPRLLLSSTERRPRGLGNGHDLVGRYLQDHPNAYAARVSTPTPLYLQDRYGILYRRRRRYFPRIVLAADTARREESLGAAAVVAFEFAPGSAVTRIRHLARDEGARGSLPGRVAPLALRAPEVVSIAWRRFGRGRSPSSPPARIRLQLFVEQSPDRERRVTLDGERDAFGVPRARVAWTVSPREHAAAQTLVAGLQDEFARTGLGRVEPEPWLSEGDLGAWRDQYHHIGTTRMATSPRRGVVDEHGEVHDVRGLFVSGSSTFPSSSWANPVLTAVALTLRLADHLRSPRPVRL